jgi:hypothetical protein
MATIEPNPISAVEPMHGGRKSSLFTQFKLQMIMIGHQHKAVHLYAEATRKLRKPLQKVFVIGPVAKDRSSLMTTIDDVIPPLLNFQPSQTGHALVVSDLGANVKC